MVPTSRRLPAALILEVSVIAVRRTMVHNHQNTAMYFLLTALTLQLFYWLFYFFHRISALGDTRWVLGVMTHAFLWPLHWNNAHWPLLLNDILFADVTRVLVMFWHDFGWGGGGGIVARLSYNRGRLRVFFLTQRNNNSKYTRKKHLRKNIIPRSCTIWEAWDGFRWCKSF